MSHVTVIGAGIVGSCTARFAQMAGHETTLVDRLEPGEGCSFGNAGMISTVSSATQPPGPRLFRQIPRMLLDRDATLSLRWSYLPRFAPWLLAMLRGCTAAEQRRTAQAMASLLAGTTEAYDAITRGTEADRYIRRNGSLGLYRDEAEFEADAWRREMNAEMGGVQEILSTEELRQMEPAFTDEIQRAVYFPTAYSTTNPSLLTRAIADETIARGGNVVRADVTDIRIEGGRTASIVTGQGEMAIDKLVVAGGAYSHRLARLLDIDVMLDTERGYHVEISGVETRLTRPAIHYEHAYAVNPMTSGLRFAGTVEFAGVDAPQNDHRARAIWRRARPVLNGLADVDESDMRIWMGRRPTLPDFRPVIGPAPGVADCWFAFGHQHLGLTLAARTGAIVAELVSGREPGVDLTPFRADRF